jgi:prevent-host-death family protein
MSKKAFTPRAAEPQSTYVPGSRTFQVAEDIIPIAELKAKLSEIVRGLDTRPRPIVITLNGKPAAVVMSPREYDSLVDRVRVLTAIADGLADDAAGDTFSSEEVIRELEQELGPLKLDHRPKKKKKR